jgi:Tol biopolymer transport system component
VVVEVVMEMHSGACRLVYVGEDGDLYQAERTDDPQRLTCGWEGTGAAGRLYYVWPSYSPDGSHVACFGVRPGNSPEAGLYAVAQDGVSMMEIWRMTGAAPICESWSADSSRIALLLQSDDGLRLEVVDINRPGRSTVVEHGSPLFWSWSPKNRYIAVHAGGSRSVCEEARLCIYDTEDGCEEIARLDPGEFRTPAWSPDGQRIAYVESDDDEERLAIYRLEDGVSEIVRPVEGHSALLWSPDGRYLAVSEALGETPHMFTGVSLVDVRTGHREVVNDSSIVGFFWSPCSSRLVSISFNDQGGMQWSVFDVLGSRRTLDVRFYPSRELVYFCWFFDQFANSHPLISPDGERITFAGHVTDDAGNMASEDSSVYVLPLTGEAPAQRVAGGHFACWDGYVR